MPWGAFSGCHASGVPDAAPPLQPRAAISSESFGPNRPSEADIEDLLDPAVFDQLVRDTYAAELQGQMLALNPSIPRIVRRYEDAFQKVGLTFHKTRPAKKFLRLLADNPSTVVTPEMLGRFETLFDVIGKSLTKLRRRDAAPFR